MDEITKESRLEAIRAWRDVLNICEQELKDVFLEGKVAELQKETCEKRAQILELQVDMARGWLHRLGVKMPTP